jgi:pyrroline-5-carboxylate reductase
MSFKRPAIVGAGVMGEALLASLIRSGFSADSIAVLEKREDRLSQVRSKYQIGNSKIEDSDVVLLATKPQDLGETLSSLKLGKNTLLISLFAGVKSAKIESLTSDSVRVVRVMPNTPLLISKGMSVIAKGSRASKSDIDWVCDFFGKSGKVLVMKEQEMDAVTATSGSGPAYLFAFVEAMTKAAIRLGLDQSSANTLVLQTLFGAAGMLESSGKDAKTLRENVTSPKGTTAAALQVFEDSKLDEIVYEAMKAARDRSIELSD